jgi:hypothetical protein
VVQNRDTSLLSMGLQRGLDKGLRAEFRLRQNPGANWAPGLTQSVLDDNDSYEGNVVLLVRHCTFL